MMKLKEAVLIGGPWDGRRDFLKVELSEILVPTFDPSASACLRPLERTERVVYTPHVYRLHPVLSSDDCSVYLHSDTGVEGVLQVLVDGYRQERIPTSIGLSDVYRIVQSPSGPESA